MRLKRITAVEPREGFIVRLHLDDGTVVERNIEGLLSGPVFDAVKNDPALFRQVRVSNGTLVWPDGADLCPDVLIWNGPPPSDVAANPQRGYGELTAPERSRSVHESPKRFPWQKGADLEDEVAGFLRSRGVLFERRKWFTTEFGRYEVDIFIDGDPPVVIECKNPTSEAKSPSGSIQRKAQEAFFKLYLLKHYCVELPPQTRYVLVFGDLGFQVVSTQFGRRDYARFLKQALGEPLEIIGRSELAGLSVPRTTGS